MSLVFINEISISCSNGSVEIAAVGGTDLTGWQVAFYTFDSGTNYVHVGSQILPDTAANNSFGFSSTNLGFLRVDSGLANWGMFDFLVGRFGAVALIDPYGNVVQAFSSAGSGTFTSGPAAGAVFGELPFPNSFTETAWVLTGSGDESEDFTFIASNSASLGAVNAGQTITSRPSPNIFGDVGDDVIDGTYGQDSMVGGAGNDILRGLSGNDSLQGGDGNDVLQGMRGIDSMTGGNGDDILSGGQGADNMYGEAGNDIYVVDDAGDRTYEFSGQGIDEVRSHLAISLNETYTLNGPFGPEQRLRFEHIENVRLTGSTNVNATGDANNNSIWGNSGNNQLSGLGGNDFIYGGNGNDLVVGGDGNDTLRGDAGNDVIIGGRGQDIMFGGAGADIFVFGTGEFAGMTLATADRVRDFSAAQGDRVDLMPAGASSFIGNGAFTGVAGQVRYQTQGANTMVYIDQDGNGTADAAIRFHGVISFLEEHFILAPPVPMG